MAVDEFDMQARKTVRDGDGLLGIADIVLDIELDHLAVDPTRGVDGLDPGLGAALELLADGGDRSGHRPDDRNRDFVRLRGRCGKAQSHCRNLEAE